ncbi:MAG TPA: purine-nucleoside phosphorylase, partial [Pseudonocardiaceae bacterium]|nr:purine-nucleoside phosphorylase [Pseudonocardiaceae bacterium]
MPAHDVAVVLGSGWRPAADVLAPAGTGPAAEIPLAELPGFVTPQVPGQGGTLRSVQLGGRRVLVLLGRTHGYEGHGIGAVVHGVRTACAAGVGSVVLTNAAGGIADGLQVGQPVLISDHLNLTGCSPLSGPRFVDLTDAYSPQLRALARRLDPGLT